jgi:hypothetical protein
MKKKTPMREFIMGKEWIIHGQSHASYARKHGSDSAGITYPDDYELYFDLSRIRPYFVRHEVLHAFVSSSPHHAANLTAGQMEELIAQLYGEHGPEMHILVDKILNYYLK